MEKKEVKRMTIGEIVKLHNALKDAKVSKLSKESTIAYLELKIRLSEEFEKVEEKEKKIFKETLPDGFKDGDKVAPEKAYEINVLRSQLISKYNSEEVKEDINPHILTSDELFDSIMNVELNDSISSEEKATITKYLKK